MNLNGITMICLIWEHHKLTCRLFFLTYFHVSTEYPCPKNHCSLVCLYLKNHEYKNLLLLQYTPSVLLFTHSSFFFFCILKTKYLISNRKLMMCIMTPLYLWTENSCISEGVHARPHKLVSSGPWECSLVGSLAKWGVWPPTCCVHLPRPQSALAGLVRSSAMPHKHLHGAGGWRCRWVKEHCCL